jgi:hypothetical protein
VLVGSYGLFLVGERFFIGGGQWSGRFATTGPGFTTERPILSIRSATTYNGKPNSRRVRIRQLSVVTDGGNGIASFRAVLGASLTGSAFAPYATLGTTADNGVTLTNTQTSVSLDSTASAATGGVEVWGTLLSRNQSPGPIDMTNMEFEIWPGQTLTFLASHAVNANAGVSLNGQEESNI